MKDGQLLHSLTYTYTYIRYYCKKDPRLILTMQQSLANIIILTEKSCYQHAERRISNRKLHSFIIDH